MKNRDARFDNLKGFLIILVVFGHFLDQKLFFPAGKTTLLNAVYACIYSFHMPAMVMISGYFSRQPSDVPGYWQKQIRSLLIPFAVFDLLMWLLTSGKLIDLLIPRFTMWYLLSLFFWRLLLPVLRSIRFPLALSLVFALLVGLTKANTFLSISRTIAFLPFFLTGYYLRPEQLDRLRRVPKCIPLLALLLCLGVAVLLVLNGINPKLFHMKEPFAKLSLQPLQGLLLRALVLVTGFAASLSLFALVPAKKTPFTGFGTRTITVYLTHGLIVKSILLLNPSFTFGHQVFVLLGTAVFSAALCLLFGNRFAAKGFHAAMDAIGRLILKPEPEAHDIAEASLRKRS